MRRYAAWGASYGPSAPPSAASVAALQGRMLVLGYSSTAPGVYGESEQVVVDSYADQLGIEDRSDLNAVISEVLPVMDDDIAIAAAGGIKHGTTGDPLGIAGRVSAPGDVNWGALIALGLVLYFASRG